MADGSLARGIGYFGFHVDDVVFKSFHVLILPEILDGAITTMAGSRARRAAAAKGKNETGSIVADAPSTRLSR